MLTYQTTLNKSTNCGAELQNKNVGYCVDYNIQLENLTCCCCYADTNPETAQL